MLPLDGPGTTDNLIVSKLSALSLVRSGYDGKIIMVHYYGQEVFRNAFKQIEEISITDTGLRDGPSVAYDDGLTAGIARLVSADDGIWTMVCRGPFVAMRNIGHLFQVPRDSRAGNSHILLSCQGSQSGGGNPLIWAYRGNDFFSLIKMMGMNRKAQNESMEARIGSHFTSIALRQFERGEVVVPEADEMSWGAVNDAALVVCDWPVLSDRVSFMMGLYLSRYLGDPRGLLIDILAP